MTLIETLTLVIGLAYAGVLHHSPLTVVSQLPSQRLRFLIRHGLLLSWGLVTLQYTAHVLALHWGQAPYLARPDVVDAFLPIAGGLGLRAGLSLGVFDTHHPAATVMVLVVSLSAVLLQRTFCGWACPLGTAAEKLHQGRLRWLQQPLTPPDWLDRLLRGQKYLVLAGILFVVLIAVPKAQLVGYLNSTYHQAADLKMGAFFFTLTPTAGAILGWVVLVTAWQPQGFCRYFCPYGAWLGLLGVFTPWRIRRDVSRCLNSQGIRCDKCSRACPSRIQVHQHIAVRSLECTACFSCVAACPKHTQALQLGTAHRGLRAQTRLAWLCGFLFVLPLLALVGFDFWVSHTPLAQRQWLLQQLPFLSHH